MASTLKVALSVMTSSTRYTKAMTRTLLCCALAFLFCSQAWSAPSYLPPETSNIPRPVPGPKPVIIPAYSYALTADRNDPSPLKKRTPLVLIHGWNSDYHKWDTLCKWFGKNSLLSSSFKIYRFSYDWSRPIEDNGVELARSVSYNFGENRKFVIVAHSMGGLVARSAIENYNGETPEFASRLQQFIAIATPHHGSPLANIAWLQNFSGLDRADYAAKIVAGKAVPLNNAGGYSLGWDNYDGKMPSCVWEGHACDIYDLGADPPAANRFTRTLNENLNINPRRATLLSKYIFYAGYRNQCDNVSPQMLGYWAIKDHNLASGALLSYYFFNEKREAIRSYVANDGVVPLSSALLLPSFADSGSLSKDGTRIVVDETLVKAQCPVVCRIFGNEEHIDHSEIPEKTSVFEALKEDLLSPLPSPLTNALPKTSQSGLDSTQPPGAASSAPILVIDRSGSIANQPGVMQQVQSRAVEVVDAIQANVKEAAIINFSGVGQSAVDTGFTSNRIALLKAIRNPSVDNNGTAIYDAINRAVTLANDQDKKAMVILFTDGQNNAGSDLGKAIVRCKQNNVPVVIVGFIGSQGRDEDALNELALGTFGFYVRAENLNIKDVLSRFKDYSITKEGAAPDGLPN